MVLDRVKLKKPLKEKDVTLDISRWKCCDQQDKKGRKPALRTVTFF